MGRIPAPAAPGARPRDPGPERAPPPPRLARPPASLIRCPARPRGPPRSLSPPGRAAAAAGGAARRGRAGGARRRPAAGAPGCAMRGGGGAEVPGMEQLPGARAAAGCGEQSRRGRLATRRRARLAVPQALPMQLFALKHARSHTHEHTHTHTHTHTRARAHARTHALTRTRTHARTPPHTHTPHHTTRHAHVHPHTHTAPGGGQAWLRRSGARVLAAVGARHGRPGVQARPGLWGGQGRERLGSAAWAGATPAVGGSRSCHAGGAGVGWRNAGPRPCLCPMAGCVGLPAGRPIRRKAAPAFLHPPAPHHVLPLPHQPNPSLPARPPWGSCASWGQT
jgi:hypothetical protein